MKMMAEGPSCSSNPIRRQDLQVKINDLVQILINDPVLLDKWYQFCAILECPPQDRLRWQRGIKNGTSPYFEAFYEMLDSWVERNSYKITVADLCHALRGIQCLDVAEKLKSEFKTDEIIRQGDNSSTKRKLFVRTGKELKWPLKHGLFVPTGNFTGREEQLKQMKISFNSKKNLMLITGFGGIGKTELCRKFAHKICKSVSFRVPSCVWLHGENLETLRDSVLKLARVLGVTNEGNPPVSEYFEYIVSFILENSSRLLLVIDNVDNIYGEVLNTINIIRLAKYEKIFAIVTSRDSNVLQGAGITIKLDVLSKLQAKSMLKSSMSGLADSDAEKLAKLVQNFPLALQQALAYIKQQRKHFRTPNYSVTDYVNEFELKRSQMLDHKLNAFEHDYAMTTSVTWDMTISKISDGAVEILKIIAFLDPGGVVLKFLDMICTHMGAVDFDGGLDMLNSYCLIKIEDRLFFVDKVISVHRLVQEVMRGRVDNDYPKRLFNSVFLVRWELFGDRFNFSDDFHLKSVFKFVWKYEMRRINYFGDALFFLLEFDLIDCAEKLTKLKYPHIEFSSEFVVEKRELIEKVLLWCFVCGDLKTNSEEIVKGEFNVHWNVVKDAEFYVYFYSLETVEGCLQISEKYFGESSKITFVLKNIFVRKLTERYDFDRALELCEELAIFPFEDDDGQANFLYHTIHYSLLEHDDESESVTPSRLANLEKIMNKIIKTNKNDPIEWMKLEASRCDFKGDYKKALELFTEIVPEHEYYKCKIIELRIKLTDFDRITVEEFIREFGGVDFDNDYFKLRGLEKMLAIYELNFGEDHELRINLKLAIARRLKYRKTTEKRQRCIELCEQILRSKFDQKYEDAFDYLCMAMYNIEYAIFYLSEARRIKYGGDEGRKILQNLLKTKRRELGKNHRNTKVVLKLLEKYEDEKSHILNK